MPRIRTIKPEFWSSPDIGDVSRDARLTFIGLFNMADDTGRLEAVPTQIRATVFPFDDDITVDQVCVWLNELALQGLIHLYASGRRAYLHITGWGDHQRIDKPSQPRCPDPDDCRQLDVITPTIHRDLARPSDGPPATLPGLSLDPREGVESPSGPERRSVGPSERRTVDPSSPAGDGTTDQPAGDDQDDPHALADEQFEDHFWPTYPRMPNGTKPEKGKALQQWRKLTVDQRRRALRGARHLADGDTIPKHAHRFLRRDTAGEFPFDDWQQPPSEPGRAPPVAACPDCQAPMDRHDDEVCSLVKAGKL